MNTKRNTTPKTKHTNFKNRLIIAGSREMNLCQSSYQILSSFVESYLEENNMIPWNTEIVLGGAKGADEIGEDFALNNGFQIKKFLPDWNLGKKAGPLRNKQMAEYSTHLICFWDGNSRGSRSMIHIAQRIGLAVRVVNYNIVSIVLDQRPLVGKE
ncbi:DUF2493 domain-containing protein (plasmid) [Flammeovirga sp. MY04]|uniref:SLOG family protein n=1 Tax=Flammeovirga sp. MY04 TaxID=1191459 RepID=UPI0008063859|nr:SLOG family protein [Flammeovirga sp. MY04]ANQ52903.1 DUF2493 domain-containing protein [Flammeovirga sp. MY04]